MKLQYELRFNPDLPEPDPWLYVWNYDDPRPVDIIKFGSLDEADIWLAAMGMEKGEPKRVEPFGRRGFEYRNVLMWEVRPCS